MDSSDSSDDEYYKRRQRAKNNKKKRQSKMRFHDPIKKYSKLIAKLLTAAYKPKVIHLKFDRDPLQHQVNFLSFMNQLKIILSQFK